MISDPRQARVARDKLDPVLRSYYDMLPVEDQDRLAPLIATSAPGLHAEILRLALGRRGVDVSKTLLAPGVLADATESQETQAAPSLAPGEQQTGMGPVVGPEPPQVGPPLVTPGVGAQPAGTVRGGGAEFTDQTRLTAQEEWGRDLADLLIRNPKWGGPGVTSWSVVPLAAGAAKGIGRAVGSIGRLLNWTGKTQPLPWMDPEGRYWKPLAKVANALYLAGHGAEDRAKNELAMLLSEQGKVIQFGGEVLFKTFALTGEIAPMLLATHYMGPAGIVAWESLVGFGEGGVPGAVSGAVRGVVLTTFLGLSSYAAMRAFPNNYALQFAMRTGTVGLGFGASTRLGGGDWSDAVASAIQAFAFDIAHYGRGYTNFEASRYRKAINALYFMTDAKAEEVLVQGSNGVITPEVIRQAGGAKRVLAELLARGAREHKALSEAALKIFVEQSLNDPVMRDYFKKYFAELPQPESGLTESELASKVVAGPETMGRLFPDEPGSTVVGGTGKAAPAEAQSKTPAEASAGGPYQVGLPIGDWTSWRQVKRPVTERGEQSGDTGPRQAVTPKAKKGAPRGSIDLELLLWWVELPKKILSRIFSREEKVKGQSYAAIPIQEEKTGRGAPSPTPKKDLPGLSKQPVNVNPRVLAEPLGETASGGQGAAQVEHPLKATTAMALADRADVKSTINALAKLVAIGQLPEIRQLPRFLSSADLAKVANKTLCPEMAAADITRVIGARLYDRVADHKTRAAIINEDTEILRRVISRLSPEGGKEIVNKFIEQAGDLWPSHPPEMSNLATDLMQYLKNRDAFLERELGSQLRGSRSGVISWGSELADIFFKDMVDKLDIILYEGAPASNLTPEQLGLRDGSVISYRGIPLFVVPKHRVLLDRIHQAVSGVVGPQEANNISISTLAYVDFSPLEGAGAGPGSLMAPSRPPVRERVNPAAKGVKPVDGRELAEPFAKQIINRLAQVGSRLSEGGLKDVPFYPIRYVYYDSKTDKYYVKTNFFNRDDVLWAIKNGQYSAVRLFDPKYGYSATISPAMKGGRLNYIVTFAKLVSDYIPGRFVDPGTEKVYEWGPRVDYKIEGKLRDARIKELVQQGYNPKDAKELVYSELVQQGKVLVVERPREPRWVEGETVYKELSRRVYRLNDIYEVALLFGKLGSILPGDVDTFARHRRNTLGDMTEYLKAGQKKSLSPTETPYRVIWKKSGEAQMWSETGPLSRTQAMAAIDLLNEGAAVARFLVDRSVSGDSLIKRSYYMYLRERAKELLPKEFMEKFGDSLLDVLKIMIKNTSNAEELFGVWRYLAEIIANARGIKDGPAPFLYGSVYDYAKMSLDEVELLNLSEGKSTKLGDSLAEKLSPASGATIMHEGATVALVPPGMVNRVITELRLKFPGEKFSIGGDVSIKYKDEPPFSKPEDILRAVRERVELLREFEEWKSRLGILGEDDAEFYQDAPGMLRENMLKEWRQDPELLEAELGDGDIVPGFRAAIADILGEDTEYAGGYSADALGRKRFVEPDAVWAGGFEHVMLAPNRSDIKTRMDLLEWLGRVANEYLGEMMDPDDLRMLKEKIETAQAELATKEAMTKIALGSKPYLQPGEQQKLRFKSYIEPDLPVEKSTGVVTEPVGPDNIILPTAVVDRGGLPDVPEYRLGMQLHSRLDSLSGVRLVSEISGTPRTVKLKRFVFGGDDAKLLETLRSELGSAVSFDQDGVNITITAPEGLRGAEADAWWSKTALTLERVFGFSGAKWPRGFASIDLFMAPFKAIKALAAMFSRHSPLMEYTRRRFVTEWIDRFYPIERLDAILKDAGIQTTPTELYKMVRLLGGVAGMAEAKLYKGFYKRTDTGKIEWMKDGPWPLVKILRKVGTNRKNDFDTYLRARRYLERWDILFAESGEAYNEAVAEVQMAKQQGKYDPMKGLMDRDDALKLKLKYEDMHKDFKALGKEFTRYCNQLLIEQAEVGLLPKSLVQSLIKKFLGYAPLFKDVEEFAKDVLGYEFKYVNPKQSRGLREELSGIHSTTRKTRHDIGAIGMTDLAPTDSAIMLTYQTTSAVEHARAQRAIIDGLRELSKHYGVQFIERFESEPSTADPRLAVIETKEDGRTVYYRVPEDIAAAMKVMYDTATSGIVKLAGVFSRILRSGATLSVDFQIANPIRDQWSALFNTRGANYIPAVDFARGFFSLLKQDDAYWRWKAAGGEWSMLAAINRDLAHRMAVSAGAARKGFMDYIEGASEMTEKPTRLGVFKKVEGKTGSTLEAAYQSRVATTDYRTRGASPVARDVSVMYAFYNARIQTAYQHYRTLRDSPEQAAMRLLVGTVVPELILYAFNRDEDEYKSMPLEEKARYYLIPWKTEDGRFLRIPRGTTGLTVGNMVRYMLEWMDSDREAAPELRELLSGIIEAISPMDVDVDRPVESVIAGSAFPTAVRPIIEWVADRNFFSGTPLTLEGQKDFQAWQQVRPGTSNTAVMLGRMARPLTSNREGVNPSKIENTVRGYTGNVGTSVLYASDLVLGALGIKPVGDRPERYRHGPVFVRALTSASPYGSGSQEYRDFMDTLQALRKINATAKRLLSQSEYRPEFLAETAAEISNLAQVYPGMKEFLKVLVALSDSDALTTPGGMTELDKDMDVIYSIMKHIRDVRLDPTITGKMKAELILADNKALSSIAKKWNHLVRTVLKQDKSDERDRRILR